MSAILRSVLDHVERHYLEPRRIDPRRMFDRAVSERSGSTGNLVECSPIPHGSLADRLGSALLDLAARCGDPSWVPVLDAALRSLDPYCRAVSGESRRRLLARFEGTLGGVGLHIGRRDGRVEVLACLAHSPAQAGGVRAGDRLRRVDHRSVDGLKISQITELLRGMPGSRVALEFERDGAEPSLRELERATLTRPTVYGKVLGEGGPALLRIAHLSRRTPEQCFDALRRIRRQAALKGLILDLRGNSGGSMLAAAKIADRFVEQTVLLEALDRHGRPVPGLRARFDASPGGDLTTPIVVLIDARTASSAELLAAALSRADRALLVGTRSFGKNFVQKLYPFADADLTVKLSAAYTHSAGRRLPEGGIEPDVALEPATQVEPEDRWARTAAALLARGASPSRTRWLENSARGSGGLWNRACDASAD